MLLGMQEESMQLREKVKEEDKNAGNAILQTEKMSA